MVNEDTLNGTTEVTGTFDPVTINISIPATNSFSFDTTTRTQHVTPFHIENNTKAPVYAVVKSISVAPTSSWKPNLVDPYSISGTDWSNLTNSETRSKISLGLLGYRSDADWLNGIIDRDIWSTDLASNPIKMGVIRFESRVGVEPLIKTGASYDTQLVVTTNYSFEFGLE